ncbi:odorant-binding protein-like [Tamandua tetradactyla]|uniref:odorant-binding protein-like n=1 Tax=Tamandua tetradactyla TaxID=48850 RepID=UPI004054313D
MDTSTDGWYKKSLQNLPHTHPFSTLPEGLTSTSKMKILLLTLLLGVVCADVDSILEEIPEIGADLLGVSGTLHTIYIGATDPDAIAENSPLRGYVRQIQQRDDGNILSVIFYTVIDSVCQLQTVEGTRTDAEGTYTSNYQGTVELSSTDLNPNLSVLNVLNQSEDGKVTRIIGLIGSGDDVEDADYSQYVAMAAEMGIPEENIIKVTDSDICPGTIN